MDADVPGAPRHWRSSPSFIVAVVLAFCAVGGYAAWRMWFPPPGKQAERIVREFVRGAAREVGRFRREMRDLRAQVEIDPATRGQAIATVDGRAHEAVAAIDARAEETMDRIEEIDQLALQTQRNRVRRVRTRLREAKRLITELATETKVELQGTREAEGRSP